VDSEAAKPPVAPAHEPPNGMYPARVDDKGRLKLPAGFEKWVASLPEKKLFVTSLDRRIGQIYPIENWRKNKDFFDKFRDNPKASKRIAFNAQDLGADSEMDGQGRILLPPELRRALGIENATVRLYAYKGRIEILSERIYEERKQESAATAEEDQEALEVAGLI
jgi:MraZ protein